jgi:hypothetical protein
VAKKSALVHARQFRAWFANAHHFNAVICSRGAKRVSPRWPDGSPVRCVEFANPFAETTQAVAHKGLRMLGRKKRLPAAGNVSGGQAAAKGIAVRDRKDRPVACPAPMTIQFDLNCHALSLLVRMPPRIFPPALQAPLRGSRFGTARHGHNRQPIGLQTCAGGPACLCR